MKKNKITQFAISKASCWVASLFLLALSPLSFAAANATAANTANGYGVSGDSEPTTEQDITRLTNAKIESLIGAKSKPQPVYYPHNPHPMPANQQAEPSPEGSPYGNDPVGNQAFAGMVRNMLPLTPEQIKTLHYLFSKSRQAAAQYPGVPPKPTSTSMTINLSPGAAPPVVRLQQGFVSSLVFVDATGAPWPVQAYDLGNGQAFNIQWDKKGNTLMVQALSPFTSGNLAVMLRGLDTPIMVTLLPGQHAVDYRVDMRIPRIGPNANPALEGLPQTESPDLMNVLNGIPPAHSDALVVKGDGNASAWRVGDHVYLRTTMTLVSPAFISTMSSPDGTHAYEIQATPVLLALSHGKTTTLTIEGL